LYLLYAYYNNGNISLSEDKTENTLLINIVCLQEIRFGSFLKAYELWSHLINGFHMEGSGEIQKEYFGNLKGERQMSEWKRLGSDPGGEQKYLKTFVLNSFCSALVTHQEYVKCAELSEKSIRLIEKDVFVSKKNRENLKSENFQLLLRN